ncbi:hypothetical protein [Bacillus infantis]|uniref:Uncharacterized protein n=1 Tax=Bacillus infantis TaxID=324767 RepID=A0A5D4RFM6_9BACI|nr:hypothetical protein [Bacillus infantis]TYS50097.1 hypothetical protein FZD51_05970 [Bacillus infantis]
MDLNNEKYVDVEAVTENGTYAAVASIDVVRLMMDADIVTIRGTSITVGEVEVTDNGVIRFHGNVTNL